MAGTCNATLVPARSAGALAHERAGDGVRPGLVRRSILAELGRFDELRRYAAAYAQDLLLTDGLPLEARETAKLWAVAGA